MLTVLLTKEEAAVMKTVATVKELEAQTPLRLASFGSGRSAGAVLL